ESGAPLMTIPTKIEIKPIIRPTTVDVSKTIPLLFARQAWNFNGRGSLRPVSFEDYFFTAYSVAQ
ncbi:MAG: hypothetical protein IKW79_06705, partial [Schwartzia sp.]|nr:hypothetical protein [Schwartzia sp. (in: firmicutes)]